ncbi:carboxypeptidase-like regulatory domain-containing protein [Pedobacter caeni]|uniref:Prealbumin-like fold domain-containing protein n=1 Tax=Pedobacter caeni TaxID=288992 RepID=A0A1M5BKS7_9SPHI|nr:carboxypeptidase-like regulatory domain-containing protein [Pedobacter caeni]SHF43154.1 hypothetical protein SAMN04488522_1021243 [Pedobacter caeni]
MKCKTILLLGLSILVLSCKKITNVKVTDAVSTGNLSYKIVDDSGNGLAGVKVSLYDSRISYSTSTPNPNALVDSIRTNQEGIAYFSNLLPKSYLVTADSPVVNKIKYRTDEFIQIVADTRKEKTIQASSFSGLLNIRLISENDRRTPLKNLGVVAYPLKSVQPNSDNVTNIIKAAPLKGLTDENGFVSIKVPSNIAFGLIIYNPNNGNLGYGYGPVGVEKDKTNELQLYSFAF